MHGIVDSKQCLTEPVAQVVLTLYLASLSIASHSVSVASPRFGCIGEGTWLERHKLFIWHMHDNAGPPGSYGILLGMNLLYICLTRAVLIGAVKTKLNKLTVSFFF